VNGLAPRRAAGALAELGDELDELLEARGAPITARRVWLETWFECNPDFTPLPLTIPDGGGLAAAAVLARRERRGWVEVVTAGIGPSDRICLPARTQEAASELARCVAARLGELGRPWTLAFSQLPADDAVAHDLAGLLQTHVLGADVSAPTLSLGSERAIAAYTKRSYRQNLRTMRNRLEQARLVVALTSTRDAADVGRLARDTERLRLARDRAAGRPSMLRHPRLRAFRRAILERLAHSGEAEITTLHIGGALAAYAVVLLDGPVRRLWDTAFAPEHTRFGPGHLVVERALANALDDPSCHEFDFMRGLDEYKLRLASSVVQSTRLDAWSSSRTRALLHLASGWHSSSYYRWLAGWAAAKLRANATP
jgi:CelD/BcsL family acetyltransferase involved in cellulose biosynthesis